MWRPIPPIVSQTFHKLFALRLADGNDLACNQFNIQLFNAFHIEQIDNIAGMAAHKVFVAEFPFHFFHALVADDIFLFSMEHQVTEKPG